MSKWPYAEWISAGAEAWALGMEASTVVGLRMASLAQGGSAADREARRMVTEKIESALQLQAAMLSGRIGATPAGAKKVVRHYRRKVSANRRRLAS